MKRLVPLVFWFCAGAVLGRLAESVLFWLWMKLGIVVPVAHWLSSLGGAQMAISWLILSIHVPSWICAAVVGILGGLFVKRHLVLCLLVFGVSFAFEPVVSYYYMFSDLPNFGYAAWSAVSIPLALCCGMLFHKRKQPPGIALQPTPTVP